MVRRGLLMPGQCTITKSTQMKWQTDAAIDNEQVEVMNKCKFRKFRITSAGKIYEIKDFGNISKLC